MHNKSPLLKQYEWGIKYRFANYVVAPFCFDYSTSFHFIGHRRHSMWLNSLSDDLISECFQLYWNCNTRLLSVHVDLYYSLDSFSRREIEDIFPSDRLRHLMQIDTLFLRKIGWKYHQFAKETICMKCHSQFYGKSKRKIFNLLSADINTQHAKQENRVPDLLWDARFEHLPYKSTFCTRDKLTIIYPITLRWGLLFMNYEI